MKTILFNSATNTIIGTYPNGYTVDGKPQQVNPPIYELQYIETPVPSYNSDTQVASSAWQADLVNKTYTQVWTIRDKTTQELTAEKDAEAALAEQTLNAEETKKLLKITADAQPADDLYQYPSVYPAWKVGISVLVNEKYQYESKLYKVVQAHTTQLDWTPDVVPALFTVYNPPESIPVWVQPTGAHDAYNIGDKVHFPTINDPVYESLINANVWSPTAYPAGWKLV